MAAGRPHFSRRTAIFVIVGTVLLGGAAYLARAPHGGVGRPVATNQSPTQTTVAAPTGAFAAPTPGTPSDPGAAVDHPAVAGATHAAPAAPRAAVSKPAPTVAATPVSAINLTLEIPDPANSGKYLTSNFTVRLMPGADACTVLEQAKAEGKISFLDIDYSYLNTSLGSAYVRQINTLANNWTVKVNGTAPLGCSKVSPKANDNVTWRYQ